MQKEVTPTTKFTYSNKAHEGNKERLPIKRFCFNWGFQIMFSLQKMGFSNLFHFKLKKFLSLKESGDVKLRFACFFNSLCSFSCNLTLFFFFYGYNPIVVRKFNARWSRLLLGYDHFKQIYLFTWMVTASSFFVLFF